MGAGFRDAIEYLRGLLDWMPGWLSAVIIVVAVSALALYLHGLALRLIHGSRASKGRFVRLLLMRGANPTRLAILLFAVSISIPVAGIPDPVQQALIAPLTSVFILLMGWIAVAAVGLASDLYLDRLDTGYENALTRKHVTQIRVLRRAADVLIGLITVGAAMMTLPQVRQYGVSLFASAGAAGIVVGLAARPLLSNLLAGIQIAITQPIKIEDSVVINGEWGWIEDITSTYLVVRIWDWRRLIVPLSWFLEQPFQNWTRESAAIIGSVHFFVDYRTDVEELRRELDRLVHKSKLWDGNVVNLQVVEATAEALQIRVLATARDASRSWDLRCELREGLIAFLQANRPESLPHRRMHLHVADGVVPVRPEADQQPQPIERTAGRR